MKKHPRLLTGLAMAALLLVFLVPAALAQPGKGDPNANGVCPPNNKHCSPTTTTSTSTTSTSTTSTTTYPPTTTSTTSTTTTTSSTSTPPGKPTPCKDGGPPPCKHGHNKSADLGSSSGIPVGIAFAGLGAVGLAYLAIQRRRAMKLDR